MKLRNLSFSRRWDSYAAVQPWIGRWMRNRRSQLDRPRVRALRHVDIGCGLNRHNALLNLDWQWTPGLDLCWDITQGLPFADQSMLGVYSEHCFEHFDLATVRRVVADVRRILLPGGTLRIAVPDAELYLRCYVQQLDGAPGEDFPFGQSERTDPLWTPLASVNRVFYQDRESPFGHRTMFDFRSLKKILETAGFTAICRVGFRTGRDPVLLVDSEVRRPESLYVEAVAP